MPAIRHNVLVASLLLLQACASTSPTGDESATGQAQGDGEVVPELTLNLPDDSIAPCPVGEGNDYTLLDRGFSALVAGQYIDAVTYFQRYQRLESSARAQWEAEIAIAYNSILPQSPFYDAAAARKSWQHLKDEQPRDVVIHEKVLMMRDALAAFAAMEIQIRALRNDNARLSADLEKREEAIRRLRELTLGQKGATQ